MRQTKFSTLLALVLLAVHTNAQLPDSLTHLQKNDPITANIPREQKGIGGGKFKIKIPYEFEPRIFIGGGLMKFFGEVKDFQPAGIHALGNRYAFDVGLSFNISNSFDFNFSFLKGQLSGNENNRGLHRNFETKFQNFQAEFTYNFLHVFKKRTTFFPFVSAGIAFMQYDVNQDLKGAGNNKYYYWSNGELSTVPEGQPGDLIPIVRDYSYETRAFLRTKAALALPLGVGFGFNISKKWALLFGSNYYFSLSDDLDADSKNINQTYLDNTGLKSRNNRNDGYLYTYAKISYCFYPAERKRKTEENPGLFLVDFDAIETEDADQDGIADFYDKCLGTPKLIAVDVVGCPLDSDQDGIPNYLDKETNTLKNFVTDVYGKSIDLNSLPLNASDTLAQLRKYVNEAVVLQNPSQKENVVYTIHVGTYDNSISNRTIIKLNSIEGLVETKINDSLTVYTVGNFSDFKQAEARKNQLLEAGYDQAFSINEKKLTTVAQELSRLSTALLDTAGFIQSDELLHFKVELTEYRITIGMDKIANLIASYGVEVRSSTGGLKTYTIGDFRTPEEANRLMEEVIKLGLKEAKTVAYLNERSLDMNEALKRYNGLKK